MILTDAGPLVALIHTAEPDHRRCVDALGGLSRPMVTTWPAMTEAMYLLGEARGWSAQATLWRLMQRGDIAVETLSDSLIAETRKLMEKYRDLPMDLADATLVALAQAKRTRRIFTLDGDFAAYRLPGGHRFEIVPA